MPFLTINGITIDVALDSATVEAPEEIGETTRAFGGDLRRSRQTTKQGYSAETVPMTAAEARALRSLLLGKGHRWGFDASLYSSKGLGPDAGYAAAQVTSGGSKFGAGHLEVDATTGTITFATGYGDDWTVMVWRYEGSAWVHYVVCSTGDKWVDGAQNNAASTGWLSVTDGDVTITNSAGAVQEYDDLVVLPMVAGSEWAAAVYSAGVAFSDLPKLTASGDFIEGNATVMGEVEASPNIRAVMGGSAHKNLQKVKFRLREV